MTENQTVPYLDRIKCDIGTRKNPILFHVTRGQRDDSFIFHTKEDRKYFQYNKTSINKSSIQLKCMYATRKNCSAQLSIIANKPNRIQKGEGNQRYRFFTNKNIILDTNSGEDWTVKLDSGKNDHSEFCLNQVPLPKRPRMEDIAEEIATAVEIKAYNQQWSRFGPGQSLCRAFRHTHTRAAIINKIYKLSVSIYT